MDYFDILLAKKLEDDRDPKVEGLSVSANGRYHEDGVVYDPVIVNVPETPFSKLTVTENGTYTAPTGTAYNEVEVDVPLPENAYLLKDIENTPTAIATFTDGADLPMPKLEVAIEPQQDLHGYDAPWVGGAGKNKYSILIGADEWNGNSSGTATNDNGTLVVSATSTDNSGAYSKLSAIIYTLSGQYSEEVTYSFDIKSDVAGKVLIGYTDIGRKEVSVTTSWQRVMITATAIGSNKAFVIYNKSGSARSIQIKNFMFETGSTAHDYEPYSNICPISGWDEVNVGVSGVNVWDEEWEVGGLNPLNGENTSENDRIRSKNYRPCKPNMTMFYYIPSGKGNLQIVFYDINKNYLGYYNFTTEHTFTTPNGCFFFKFNTGGGYGTTYNHDISINYPSTDTTYHAYNGQTYTIDLDGTRYGGKVDLVSGVMTVDRAFLTNNYLVNTAGYESAGKGCFVLSGITLKNSGSDVVDTKLIASALKTSSQNDLYTNKNIGIAHWWNTRIGFSTGDETITTVSAFKQWLALNGSDVCYELATPFTVQLPTTVVKSLRGMNNVWADSGNILDLSYLAKEE